MQKVYIILVIILFMLAFGSYKAEIPTFSEKINLQVKEDELALIIIRDNNLMITLIKDDNYAYLIDCDDFENMKKLKDILTRFNIKELRDIYVFEDDNYESYETMFNNTNLIHPSIGKHYLSENSSIEILDEDNYLINFGKYHITFIIDDLENKRINYQILEKVNLFVLNHRYDVSKISSDIITIFYRPNIYTSNELKQIYNHFIDTEVLRSNEYRIIKFTPNEFNYFTIPIK